MAIIVDIDGTLADNRHRLPLIRKLPQDWSGFYDALGEDKLIKPIADIVKDLCRSNHIVLLTGRPENYRRPTEQWLGVNFIPFNALYMRAVNDLRPDYIVKSEMLERIKADGYNPTLAIDDRPEVAHMFLQRGLICLLNLQGENK